MKKRNSKELIIKIKAAQYISNCSDVCPAICNKAANLKPNLVGKL
ncbi:hypothetical protein [Candidatus Portiera aleyrodidarum]|nr:hypothetical protein [Candidatus Portiera aleyrodidarum]